MATYLCDDGNAELEVTADSAREAAQEYVDGGDWGDDAATSWVTVYVALVPDDDEMTEALVAVGMETDLPDDDEIALIPADEASYDALVVPDGWSTRWADGVMRLQRNAERESHKIAIEPTEPDCDRGDYGAGHDWQSPIEIVGGIRDNPGVYGHGGGVTIAEVCVRCGCGKHLDTWAQDRTDGQQGLSAISYEPGEYIEALREHNLVETE